MTKEIVIVGGARTPFAEYSGSKGFGQFKNKSAIELGAIATKAALERSGVSPKQIQHVIMGNALQTSTDAIYGARHVGLKAGCPIETPALTVNRLCGSGLQSIISGAQLIMLDEADFVVAGGMENMSQAPFCVYGTRGGSGFGKPVAFEDLLFAALKDSQCGLFMAQTAEKLATKYKITREEQDDFAWRSMRLAIESTDKGLFREEIVPVDIKGTRVMRDDHVKPKSNREGLNKLRPAFGIEGTVTAGNASGIVDGAAAVILTSREKAEEHKLNILCSVKGWGITGVDPAIMGIGPAPAIELCLKRIGASLESVDLFEINEAFAAQYLAVERTLDLDREKVNVNGGAIGLGHPLGATGTRLALTLGHEMRRREAQLGIASACIGGGQGIAVALGAP
jgi:acetyl-CoA acyltransferase 2